MVSTLDTVLLVPRQTKLASTTNAAQKSNADQTTQLDPVAAIWPDGNDASDAFVSADVWELDVCDGAAVRACSRTAFRMQVCLYNSLVNDSACRSYFILFS